MTVETGLRDIHVEGRTDGLLLTLDLDQHYANRGDASIEVVYSFAIPSDAVILAVDLSLDGTAVAARLRDRGDAEDAFEDAQATTGFAAVVERVAPGLCVASLGRLAPGSDAVLRVRMARFLDVVGTTARIAVPSVATYPEGSAVGSTGPAGPPRPSLHAEYPLSFRLQLAGAAAAARASSPSHRLSISRGDDTTELTLAEPSALDRDVVILLDRLPPQQGVLCRDRRGCIGIAAFSLTNDGARRVVDVDVLIDAAGPLHEAPDRPGGFLTALLAGLESSDRIVVQLAGKALEPIVATRIGAVPTFPTIVVPAVAVVGDVPIGEDLPERCLRAGTDIVLVSDGRSRVAEAICALALAKGRRLFVLAVGPAPNEAILAPAAAAARGDYVALAPGEPPEPAARRLLGALAVPPLEAVHRWSAIPAWTAPPPLWRIGKRVVVVAGFEGEAPRSSILVASAGGEALSCELGKQSLDAAFANAMIATAAARRLPHLSDAERAAWASRFALQTGATAWLALSGNDESAVEDARLVIVPQMVAARGRGLGMLPPMPAPAAPPPRPAFGRPLLGAIAAILLVAIAGGTWLADRSAAPHGAFPERFDRGPIGQAGPRAPVNAPGQAFSPIAVGGAARRPSAIPPRLGAAGFALLVLALVLVVRRRRRRR